ncbi:Cwf15/Cwc15 cell cycle control protein-domain-containing protein [Schizophyllum commune]
MSTAHRPTWDPAQAKDVKGVSRQFSVRDMASHTKLKFRQAGQTSQDEVKKRDLRAELFAAELEAKNKKRKAEGKPPLSIESGTSESGQDEESNKRRKLLQEALEADKDSDEEEEGEEGEKKSKAGDAEEDEEDDSDEDEDEDDTDELLRELEKIKRERAEEKARQEREQSATDAVAREAEIATANPLLNLAAALGQQQPQGLNTTAPGSFAVKRRWDDGAWWPLVEGWAAELTVLADLIFKNQAMDTRDKNDRGFVNDLLRTEFHKKFMAKFIK